MAVMTVVSAPCVCGHRVSAMTDESWKAAMEDHLAYAKCGQVVIERRVRRPGEAE